MKAGVLLALGVLVAACARPPVALRGEYPRLTPADVREGGVRGERVRWGGEIVRTTPGRDDTCFEVVSLPLDRRAEPRPVDETFGRFVACAPGFYDPAIYAEKRDITVVGALDGLTSGQIGEREYSFPLVRADAIHLWPKPEPQRAVIYDPWPYYWGGYPYWYWGRGAWFGGHRVLR